MISFRLRWLALALLLATPLFALTVPTVTLTSSNNPAQDGETVLLSATVSSQGGPTATGYVLFRAEGTNLTYGQAPLVDGVATWLATLPKYSSTTNHYFLYAHYSGDATYAETTSSILQQVIYTPIGSQTFGDFNGDGKADLVLADGFGALHVRVMNGTTPTAVMLSHSESITSIWRVAAYADFNGDSTVDELWYHWTSFTMQLQLKNGATEDEPNRYLIQPPIAMPSVSSTAWRPVGAGDFDGDGNQDVVWQNTATAQTVVWRLDKGTYLGEMPLPGVSSGAWSILTVADFSNDGSPDLLWRNSQTSQTVIWVMNGANYLYEAALPSIGTAWSLAAVADYTGDGYRDLVWRHDSSGATEGWRMAGTVYAGGLTFSGLAPHYTTHGPK